MLKLLTLLVILMTSHQSYAAFNDCLGVYVGRISVNKDTGTNMVVLMGSPDNASGSYWVNFNGWDSEARKEALSILLSAKMSRHRVDVYTTAQDKCSIGSPGQTFNEIHISTNNK